MFWCGIPLYEIQSSTFHAEGGGHQSCSVKSARVCIGFPKGVPVAIDGIYPGL